MHAKILVFGLVVGLSLTSLTLGLLSPVPDAQAVPQWPTAPKLETFTVNIERAGLNKGAQGSTIPPRALVSAKVRLTNLGMEEKRDVLLHLTLENNRGELVAESSLLVYVPYQKTNTYTVDILTREGGNLSLIAEVVSQGRAALAEPVDLSISPMDLFV